MNNLIKTVGNFVFWVVANEWKCFVQYVHERTTENELQYRGISNEAKKDGKLKPPITQNEYSDESTNLGEREIVVGQNKHKHLMESIDEECKKRSFEKWVNEQMFDVFVSERKSLSEDRKQNLMKWALNKGDVEKVNTLVRKGVPLVSLCDALLESKSHIFLNTLLLLRKNDFDDVSEMKQLPDLMFSDSLHLLLSTNDYFKTNRALPEYVAGRIIDMLSWLKEELIDLLTKQTYLLGENKELYKCLLNKLKEHGRWKNLLDYLKTHDKELSCVKDLTLDECKLLIKKGEVPSIDFVMQIIEASCASEKLKTELHILLDKDFIRSIQDNPKLIICWIESGYLDIDRACVEDTDSVIKFLLNSGKVELRNIAIKYSKESFLKGFQLMDGNKPISELRGKEEVQFTYIAILVKDPYESSTGVYELCRRYMEANSKVKFVIITSELKNYFGKGMFHYFDGIILPGGEHGYLENEISKDNYDVSKYGVTIERLQREVLLERMDVPCLGFCLGLQSMALDAGALLYKLDGHKEKTTIIYGTVMHFLMCASADKIKLLNGEILQPVVLAYPYYNHSYAIKEKGNLVINAITEDGVIVGGELEFDAIGTQFHSEISQFCPDEYSDKNGYQINYLDGAHEQFARMNRYLQGVRKLEALLGVDEVLTQELLEKARELAVSAKKKADAVVLDRLKFLRERAEKKKELEVDTDGIKVEKKEENNNEGGDLVIEILEERSNWKPLEEKAFTWDLIDGPILKDLQADIEGLIKGSLKE